MLNLAVASESVPVYYFGGMYVGGGLPIWYGGKKQPCSYRKMPISKGHKDNHRSYLRALTEQ